MSTTCSAACGVLQTGVAGSKDSRGTYPISILSPGIRIFLTAGNPAKTGFRFLERTKLEKTGESNPRKMQQWDSTWPCQIDSGFHQGIQSRSQEAVGNGGHTGRLCLRLFPKLPHGFLNSGNPKPQSPRGEKSAKRDTSSPKETVERLLLDSPALTANVSTWTPRQVAKLLCPAILPQSGGQSAHRMVKGRGQKNLSWGVSRCRVELARKRIKSVSLVRHRDIPPPLVETRANGNAQNTGDV